MITQARDRRQLIIEAPVRGALPGRKIFLEMAGEIDLRRQPCDDHLRGGWLYRSVNTVVWGLLFAAIFGPGPVAGIWAIAMRSIGFMGKLIVEAIEATGAPRLQVLMLGMLPQVLPVIWGSTVDLWDALAYGAMSLR